MNDKDSPINAATNNRGRSLINLDTYKNEGFNISGYALETVVDDVILVEYVDTADGREVLRNGIIRPVAHVNMMWRIAVVHLVGSGCKQVKPGDFVCFPGDKGLNAVDVDVIKGGTVKHVKNACFLSESRIFGICQPIEDNESVASIINNSAAE